MKIYSGTKWKGNLLRIEEAKQHFLVKLAKERNEKEKTKITKKKLKKRQNQMDEDMEIVTGPRKGWVRCRYGRLLPKIKMRMPKTGRETVIDPTKYLNNFIRLDLKDLPVEISDLHFQNSDIRMDLSRDGMLMTCDNFRKRCQMWTDEELKLAKQCQEELSAKRAAVEQTFQQSGLSRKKFLKEQEIKLKLQEEHDTLMEIVGNVSNGQKAKINEGVVDFMSDEEPITKVEIGGLFDSDSE
jgi:hypothetical protein